MFLRTYIGLLIAAFLILCVSGLSADKAEAAARPSPKPSGLR